MSPVIISFLVFLSTIVFNKIIFAAGVSVSDSASAACNYDDCGDPPVILGSRTNTEVLYFSYPARLNYSCLPNMHYIRGSIWAVCNKNGTWTIPDIFCASTFCFYWRIDQGTVYAGSRNQTSTGLPCQAWVSQTPHQHSRDRINRFNTESTLEEAGNSCRDPDNQTYPWCYTMVPEVRWGYCAVPTCLKGTCGIPPAIFGTTVSFNVTSDPYIAYYSCGEGFLPLRGSTVARCLLDGAWQLPTLRCAPTTCYRLVDGHALYGGNVSQTLNRSECQRWDSQTPHPHNFNKAAMFPTDGNVSEANNSCRDPNDSGRPWCYTTSVYPHWEFCDVDPCDDKKIKGVDCGLPPDIVNAAVVFKSTTEGASAFYTCRPGYESSLREATAALCVRGTWVLPRIVCRVINEKETSNQTNCFDQSPEKANTLACPSTSTSQADTSTRRNIWGNSQWSIGWTAFLGVLVPLVVMVMVIMVAVAFLMYRRAMMRRRGDVVFSNLLYLENNAMPDS